MTIQENFQAVMRVSAPLILGARTTNGPAPVKPTGKALPQPSGAKQAMA
jgi:hypothetical protein